MHRIARGEPVLAPRALGVIAGAEGAALTGREIDVLREIASGGTNAEAALPLSEEVQAYEPVIRRYAAEYGIARLSVDQPLRSS